MTEKLNGYARRLLTNIESFTPEELREWIENETVVSIYLAAETGCGDWIADITLPAQTGQYVFGYYVMRIQSADPEVELIGSYVDTYTERLRSRHSWLDCVGEETSALFHEYIDDRIDGGRA